MGVYTKNVVCYGNELDFMKLFLKKLLATDNRLKLIIGTNNNTPVYASTESDIDDFVESEYYSNGSLRAYKPTFVIEVNGVFQARFVRNANASTAASKYDLTFVEPVTNETSTTTSLMLLSTALGAAADRERKLVFRVVTNSKLVYVHFGSYNVNLITNPTVAQRMAISDGDVSIYGKYNSTSKILKDCIVIINGAAQSCTMINRLAYNCDGNNDRKIESVHNKIFTSNDICLASTDTIYDCSTITTIYGNIVISGNTYYALDANTLVPL